MTDPETPLRVLHDLYCKLTGRNLKYQFYQREWRDYAQNFTADDLQVVLAYVERENRQREKRYQIRTELLRIIGDLAVFDSLKADAELWQKAKAARKRAWVPSESDKILGEFRATEPVPPDTSATTCRDALRKALDAARKEIDEPSKPSVQNRDIHHR